MIIEQHGMVGGQAEQAFQISSSGRLRPGKKSMAAKKLERGDIEIVMWFYHGEKTIQCMRGI